MSRQVVLMLVLLTGCGLQLESASGCRKPDELRWTNSRTMPAGAEDRLVAQMPPMFARTARAMVSDFIHYMVANVWHGVTDEWGMRHRMKASYEITATAVRDASDAERMFVLAEETYGAAMFRIRWDSEELAHRRAAMMFPGIEQDAGTGSSASYFERAPRLGDLELIARANELEQEMRYLRDRYRGWVRWETACSQALDTRENEIFTHLDNARGDFRVTTGSLRELLLARGLKSRGVTPLERETISPNHGCRKPWR